MSYTPTIYSAGMHNTAVYCTNFNNVLQNLRMLVTFNSGKKLQKIYSLTHSTCCQQIRHLLRCHTNELAVIITT